MSKEAVKPQIEKSAVTEIKKSEKLIKNKFSLEKLRENSVTLFGISPTIFDGAAHKLSGDFTVSEMKKIISEWLKKEAK